MGISANPLHFLAHTQTPLGKTLTSLRERAAAQGPRYQTLLNKILRSGNGMRNGRLDQPSK